jgi:hypothetical protein
VQPLPHCQPREGRLMNLTVIAEPVHLPGCTDAPTVSGERPYLLIVRNVRTGHMDRPAPSANPTTPATRERTNELVRRLMTVVVAWWRRCRGGWRVVARAALAASGLANPPGTV